MGAYMTVTQSVGFLENKDSSSIAYKHFNQAPQDQYPTFSICLRGPQIYWKNEHQLFNIHGITSLQYTQMLKGDGIRYDIDTHSRLYRKDPVHIKNMSSMDISEIFLTTSDIVTGASFVNDKKQIYNYGKGMHQGPRFDQIPFSIGYQTPDEICFTRNSTDELESIRQYDLVSLKSFLLSPGSHSSVEIRLIVHYPGQLLRNFDNPSFSTSLQSYDKDRLLELKISHVTTLLKRPGSNVKCNDSIENDDAKLQEEITRRIGCIPIYWSYLGAEDNNFEHCTSQQDLINAFYLIENFKDVLASYDPPCVDMTSLVFVKNDMAQSEGKFQIKVLYAENFYQEILNDQGVSFETFFSGVGGFVGIFCGYSILQLPELFEGMKKMYRRKNSAFLIGKF